MNGKYGIADPRDTLEGLLSFILAITAFMLLLTMAISIAGSSGGNEVIWRAIEQTTEWAVNLFAALLSITIPPLLEYLRGSIDA